MFNSIPFFVSRLFLAIAGLVLLFADHARGDSYFGFSENCRAAQESIFSLKLEEGQKLLDRERTKAPDNLVPLYLENYIDFFKVLIKEEKNDYSSFLIKQDERLKRIKNSEVNSPWFYFSQAEIKLQGAIARVKFQDFFSAGLEIREAYGLLSKNMRQHPGFAASLKSLGMIEALVGTVPEKYRWAINLTGLEGDIEGGVLKMQKFLSQPSSDKEIEILKKEAGQMLALLQLHLLKEPELAWETMAKYTADHRTSLFSCFMRCTVAHGTHRNSDLLQTLNERPTGNEYIDFYYLDYLSGLSRLYQLNPEADHFFKRYLAMFKGTNYVKDAYVKLAWCSLLRENRKDYQTYMLMAQKFGTTDIDDDRQASKESEKEEIPDMTLLKARLLFDGGYYNRALDVIQKKNIDDFTVNRHRLEYVYRKARIYHELKEYHKALEFYSRTIETGRNEPWYFAAYSCLQTAVINEKMGLYHLAKTNYESCFKFPQNREYQNSIEQKAKSGVKRVSKHLKN